MDVQQYFEERAAMVDESLGTFIHERFDDEGRLVDEVTRRELRSLIASRPCKDRSEAYARSLLELAGKRDLAAAA